MFYEYSLDVPASTSAYNPVTSEVQLVRGIINQVEIYFPTGCNDLVDVAVWRNLRQVWPTPPAESFSDNGYHIVFSEDQKILEPPYSLMLVGWSGDTVYPHTIRFRFGIMSQDVLLEQRLWRLPGGELIDLPELMV